MRIKINSNDYRKAIRAVAKKNKEKKMKCSRCDEIFAKEDLQKCMDGTYKCQECIGELMDMYYDSEAEYESDNYSP